jgi:hypothetical protein
MPEEEKFYSEASIHEAIGVADTVTGDLDWNMSDSEALTDFTNVYVNAFFSALKNPGRDWELDDVLNENWGDSDYDEEDYEDAAEWVRGWH